VVSVTLIIRNLLPFAPRPISESIFGQSTVTEPDVWKWRYSKNRTYRRPFPSAVCVSLAGSYDMNMRPSLPPEKNQIGDWRDAISRCLEGLICTFLSRSSITFSVPLTLPSSSLFLNFYANLDKLQDLSFQKVGTVRTPPPLPDLPWLRRWQPNLIPSIRTQIKSSNLIELHINRISIQISRIAWSAITYVNTTIVCLV